MSDDAEPLAGQLDPIRPWTIRAVSVEARDLAIGAARKEGVSVGQWLERRIRAWAEADPPRQRGRQSGHARDRRRPGPRPAAGAGHAVRGGADRRRGPRPGRGRPAHFKGHGRQGHPRPGQAAAALTGGRPQPPGRCARPPGRALCPRTATTVARPAVPSARTAGRRPGRATGRGFRPIGVRIDPQQRKNLS